MKGPQIQQTYEYHVEPKLQLQQVLSPPIYNSLEDIPASSKVQNSPIELSSDLLSSIKGAIEAENPHKPYSDESLVKFLEQYDINELVIRKARRKLQIPCASTRLKQYNI